MPKFDTGELKLYYELHGAGPPLILIAGFTCDVSHWIRILPELKQHFQVLIFDHRGAGQSDCPDVPYSLEMMGRDLIALMDYLHLSRAHILGHSMGGCIAQILALNEPHRIDKLIICNSLIKLKPTSAWCEKFILNLHQDGVNRRRLFEAIIPWIFSNEFLADTQRIEKVIELYLQNPHPQSIIGYKRQLEAIIAFDSTQWFQKITIPPLIINGEEDILCPHDSQRLAANIRGAKFVNFPRMGHVPMLEKPDEFNQIIIEYLKG